MKVTFIGLGKLGLASVDAAKSFFYTAEALAVFDECCTQLEWAVVDSTKLKYTCTFIHAKGSEYHSRMQALIDANNWSLNGHTTEVVDSHLF